MFCTFDIFRWPLNWILQLLCSPVGNQNFLSKTKLNFTTDWTPHGNEFICTFAGFKVSFPSRRHHGTLCLVLRPADLQISYTGLLFFPPFSSFKSFHFRSASVFQIAGRQDLFCRRLLLLAFPQSWSFEVLDFVFSLLAHSRLFTRKCVEKRGTHPDNRVLLIFCNLYFSC